MPFGDGDIGLCWTSSATSSFWVLMVLTMVLMVDFRCFWMLFGAADAPRINGLQFWGRLTRKRFRSPEHLRSTGVESSN